jgi:acylphosphatase
MERREIRYHGRVQGVGFRATAKSVAMKHGLTGWVKNEPDGTVLMQLQGDPDAINGCLKDLAQTMTGNIKSAEEREAPIATSEPAFEIRH